MKSSLEILKFHELIEAQERILNSFLGSYRAKIAAGILSDYTAVKTIECLKRTIKLLKKYERNPQADLFQLNTSLNLK